MPTPLWVLMLYVLWTLAILIFGVGGTRLHRVLHGEKFRDFPGGVAEGPPLHARAIRTHLNCVENLPLYAAVALTASVLSVESPTLNGLAITVIVARIAQSSVHLGLSQTEPVVRLRGILFGIQVLAIALMAIIVLTHAALPLNP